MPNSRPCPNPLFTFVCPFPMADYRLRGHRRYPDKPMRQVVVYLCPSASPLIQQTCFELERTRHEFDVICLWEQPTATFLQAPGLYPFATLSQTDNPNGVLREVARCIETIADERQQNNIAASTAILAGLVLEQEFIQTVLRQDIMRESVIFQAIEKDATQREALSLVSRLVKRRFGTLKPTLQAQFQGLSIEQLEELAELLFDFSGEADLMNWLDSH